MNYGLVTVDYIIIPVAYWSTEFMGSTFLMNFDTRIGSCPGSVRARPVGTRGGCGDGRGPGACPRPHRVGMGRPMMSPIQDKHQAPVSTPPCPLSLQPDDVPHPGQAPGPRIHPTPPLVPTGWQTPPFPHLVGNIHQAKLLAITVFSLSKTLHFTLELRF
jgi:hypothetical protein